MSAWTRKHEPLIYLGGVSHRVWLAMAYKETTDGQPDGRILREVTGKKYDITDQIGELIAELERRDLELTPKAGRRD